MLGKMKGPFSGSSHVSFRRKTAKNRNFWGRRRPTTAEGDEGDAGRVAQHFTNSGSFPIPSPRVSSPEMDRVASVFFRLSLSRNWCPERHDFFQESGDGHFRHHPIKHHIVEYHDQQTIMQHLKLSWSFWNICPFFEKHQCFSLLSVNLFFPSVPGSFFPWEFLLNDVGEGTPSSIGPFEERIEQSDQTCRMGSFLGDIFFMQFRWTILFWSPEQKLRVDIFPPFLAVCSAPGMEFKMNSKYQKSPNTKKKRNYWTQGHLMWYFLIESLLTWKFIPG